MRTRKMIGVKVDIQYLNMINEIKAMTASELGCPEEHLSDSEIVRSCISHFYAYKKRGKRKNKTA